MDVITRNRLGRRHETRKLAPKSCALKKKMFENIHLPGMAPRGYRCVEWFSCQTRHRTPALSSSVKAGSLYRSFPFLVDMQGTRSTSPTVLLMMVAYIWSYIYIPGSHPLRLWQSVEDFHAGCASMCGKRFVPSCNFRKQGYWVRT